MLSSSDHPILTACQYSVLVDAGEELLGLEVVHELVDRLPPELREDSARVGLQA